MKDLRLIELRTRAERDLALSDGAFRLLCRLVSEKYNDPTFFAEGSFPLPWTMVKRLTGAAEKWSYERIAALKKRGYIASDGLKNCPPTAHFHFMLKSIQKEGIDSIQNGRINSAQKARINSAEKGGHHISNPFRKELDQKKEGIRARQGREGNEAEGKDRARRSAEENSARVKRLAAEMRKAAS